MVGLWIRLSGDATELLEEMSPLCAPKRLPAAPGFQMGYCHAEDLAREPAAKRSHNGHLVGLEHHGGQSKVVGLKQLETLAVKEQSASIWTIVVVNIQAGGARLGTEAALIAQAG